MVHAIGKSIPRKEGLLKVTGKAVFVDDIKVENSLYGKTVRSSVPRGIIKEILFKEGVPWDEFVIVLPRDIPGMNKVSLIDTEQPFLAENEIRHVAEPLALIAHADKGLVEKALNYVEVNVDELPAVLSMEEALRGENIQYGRDNIFKEYAIEWGGASIKWHEADLVLEETYRTGAQEHLYLEPNGMIARAEPGKSVTVWGSMQCPFYVRKALAPLFALPPDQVRVIQTETGGGFGGKEEYPNLIAGHSALLSWKAGGRPVKMIYDRREDLWATTKRHPCRTRIKAGFSRDGTLIALDIDFLLDGGAYPTLSSVVLSRGILHSWGPYKCDHVNLRARCVMTNSVPYGAMRGFGAPQSIFALEMHMNKAAQLLGIDPAELRRRNFLRKGDHMPTGQVIKEDIDLGALMDRALTSADYHEKRQEFERANREKRSTRRGIGLSCFFHGSGFTGGGEVFLASVLSVRLSPTGGIEVLASNVEFGQGTNTVFAQIAAEACGIPPEWVDVHQPDTALVPNSGPTVASRTTMIVGKLLERAAKGLCDRLRSEGYLPSSHSPEEFQDAALRNLRERGGLEVTEKYEPPPDIHWDESRYCGDAYSGYAWSCDIAEVEVDMVEYSARVTGFVSAVECGRVINPILAAGQIEGGIVQAIGFALYEDVVMKQGAMANNQYTNYIIPTSADTPDIRVEFVEFPHDNNGPYQAKGIGELPMDGPAPAIASAVAQALGGRFINELPILPEKIMKVAEADMAGGRSRKHPMRSCDSFAYLQRHSDAAAYGGRK
ncbi:MAG TPA: xanthine dehydrogenase family protein molybdopterin-binding subunit [Acidobacteriota bacterium]|nr:xanthine dehydrogenase family protein molybdopterin-binding subunit [Acidobacteriota bacterium]